MRWQRSIPSRRPPTASYQQAMNNEKKLDSNPSVKFVFNGDALGADTHL